MERETYEVKLPGGRAVQMREITGNDELSAATEALTEESGARGRILFNNACVLRSLVSIDGVHFDQASANAETVRDLFRAKEWRCIQTQFDAIHVPSEDEMRSFRSSVRLSG